MSECKIRPGHNVGAGVTALIKNILRDKPLIYFAMGSSGTPEIVARILESFEGKSYRVIAPIKFLLERLEITKIPANVIVTDWVPALDVNKMADLSLIHGGIGTVVTAAYAGKPVVGVGMQMEQVANLACLVRKGFAIRVAKSKDPSRKVQEAIGLLLRDENAKRRAMAFSKGYGEMGRSQNGGGPAIAKIQVIRYARSSSIC